MTLVDELIARLKSGGWVQIRNNRHSVWQHPISLQTVPCPTSIKDTGHKRLNYLKNIERLEKTPRTAPPVDTTKKQVIVIPIKPKVTLNLPTLPLRTDADPEERVDRLIEKFLATANRCPWFQYLGSRRDLLRLGRAELGKALGWTPSKVKQMESGKLPGLTTQEIVEMAIALTIHPDLMALMVMENYIPVIDLVPKPKPKALVVPVVVPALSVAPPALPAPLEESQMVKSKTAHRGGWSSPSAAEITKRRVASGLAIEVIAERMGMTPERYLLVEDGTKKLTAANFKAWKDALEGTPAPTPVVKRGPGRPAGSKTHGKDRAALTQRAEQLLRSTRLTDAEANALLDSLEKHFIDIVLG